MSLIQHRFPSESSVVSIPAFPSIHPFKTSKPSLIANQVLEEQRHHDSAVLQAAAKLDNIDIVNGTQEDIKQYIQLITFTILKVQASSDVNTFALEKMRQQLGYLEKNLTEPKGHPAREIKKIETVEQNIKTAQDCLQHFAAHLKYREKQFILR